MAEVNNIVNQICSSSGLKGKDLDALRTRLEKLSEAELQAKLIKPLSGDNQNIEMGLVVEKANSLLTQKPVQQKISTQTSTLKEKQCKEVACQIIDENLREAFEVFNSQHLGSLTKAYDNSKYTDDKLKTSNVAKVIDYQ